MQYYRTFIALPVKVGPDFLELRRELMTALKEERISWVDPKRFHVTLRFLGDTSLNDVEQIVRALKGGGKMPDAKLVSMSGVDSFGPHKKPRVIYFGFVQKQWFNAIKEEIDGFLEELGFPLQDQPFTAHLTLGRVRSLRNLSRYHEVIEGMKTRSCESVYFDSMVYYRSVLGSQGPEYSKLKEIKFRSG